MERSANSKFIIPKRLSRMNLEVEWLGCIHFPFDSEAGLGCVSGADSSASGSGTASRYVPSAQLPRSTTRQRSLQNGTSGSDGSTRFLQMGHFI
ncbi:MAG: hypothetical protein A3H28_03440 [Acidobacteria bacterium RIFCSPLOWO2_02_FULL_61_28]|nr:MAG: hypothetical protein A3H28_03440 [Acidobacteria bacterium RIFCSPLOWO2_02_FULL_61_28]